MGRLKRIPNQTQEQKAEASRTWIQRFVATQWHAVFRGDGKIGYCSCGRGLEKIDDMTYRCESGFPVYSLREGNVFKDKYGNLYIAAIPHDNEAMKEMRENTTGTVNTGKGKRL
jgi:hypothetical protein